jgi:hypothetical protein
MSIANAMMKIRAVAAVRRLVTATQKARRVPPARLRVLTAFYAFSLDIGREPWGRR